MSRPLALPVLAYLGLYIAIAQLRSAPVHVNMVVWVLGFLIAGSALWDLYREVRGRFVLHQWLRLDDIARARAQLRHVEKLMPRLEPWYRRRFRSKKDELSKHPTRPDPYENVVTLPDLPLRRAAPSLLGRIKNSAAFILLFLVLIPVGAVSFFVWLQAVLAGARVPLVATSLWMISAAFYAFTGVAVLRDRRGKTLELAD